MGLLEDVLGKVGGSGGQAAALTSVKNLVNNAGGFQGLVTKLQQGGLGDQVQSWIGHGTNQPVSADQVAQALGQDQVQKLADQSGVSPDEISQHLAEVLPRAVDHATPDGQAPAE
jgi:uncharacterized protein YidB (DUF937 family)